MSYDVVYRQPLYRTYLASSCSGARIVCLLHRLVTLLLPLICIFASQGLWLKYADFREQPQVAFEMKYLVVSELLSATGPSTLFSSSFSHLNTLGEGMTLAAVEADQEDNNGDGKTDKLYMRVSQPLPANSTLSSFSYAFLLRYQLQYNTVVDTEVLLSSSHQFVSPCGHLHLGGVLQAHQTLPFWGDVSMKRLIDDRNTDPLYYALWNVRDRALDRNFTVHIASPSVSCSHPSAHPSFRLSLTLRIPEQSFTYRCGFWQLIKWAWVQYLALYVIFRWLGDKVLEHLYDNRIVEAVPAGKY